MTQQWQREAIVLVVGVAAFARATFPTPIINQTTKVPYESQMKARLGFVALGIFFLSVWYGIHREGLPGHW